MRAEIAKFRYLPLPRVVAGVAFVLALLPGVLLLIFEPTTASLYTASTGVANSMSVEVLAILVGAWAGTLEFSSGTLQRTLTAQSDRNRVLAAKLLVAIGFVVLLAIAAGAAAGGLVDLALDRAGHDRSEELLRALLSSGPSTLSGVFLGFGLGLLTRSLGGGVTLSVVAAFVLQGMVNFIPHASDWYYSSFVGDLSNRIGGSIGGTDPVAGHALGVSILGFVVWMVIFVAPGWLMFTRGDLK